MPSLEFVVREHVMTSWCCRRAALTVLVALTEVGVQLVHYIEGLMAPRFGAMGSSALFLQMVEGPLPECTADDRAGSHSECRVLTNNGCPRL